MSDTLGTRLIFELGRRGQSGLYFEYAGYQQLRGIDSTDELEQFLLALGYDGTWDIADESAIADQLAEQLTARYIDDHPSLWTTLPGMLYFPVWLLNRFFRS